MDHLLLAIPFALGGACFGALLYSMRCEWQAHKQYERDRRYRIDGALDKIGKLQGCELARVCEIPDLKADVSKVRHLRGFDPDHLRAQVVADTATRLQSRIDVNLSRAFELCADISQRLSDLEEEVFDEEEDEE